MVEIGADVSPLAMGGWLYIDGVITHYFATPLTQEDVGKYDMPIGEAEGQQLWEAFGILVVIDLWSSQSQLQRLVLNARSDNMVALGLLTKMRPPSTRLAVVAMELAMRLVDLSSRQMQSIRQALGMCWRIGSLE